MASGANPSARGVIGSGRSYPSNPVLPCTSSAVTNGRSSGADAPAYTGVSVRRASAKALRAFLEVRFTGTFPATVDTASNLHRRAASATSMANRVVGRGISVNDDGTGHVISTQLIERLLGLHVTGMLLEQTKQRSARLLGFTFQAINACQV